MKNLGVDGRIVWKLIIKQYSLMVWTAFVWIRMGTYMYSRNLGFLRGKKIS